MWNKKKCKNCCFQISLSKYIRFILRLNDLKSTGLIDIFTINKCLIRIRLTLYAISYLLLENELIYV